jgi:hypothetical protein
MTATAGKRCAAGLAVVQAIAGIGSLLALHRSG